MELGTQIKTLRLQRGVTQEVLAEQWDTRTSETVDKVRREINRLNTGHQWVKFVLLEEQNSVQGTYDFPIDYKVGKALDYDYASHQIGRAVADLVEFLVIAADEAYPQLAEIAYS